MRQRVKVMVSGAAGQIGYALLFRIASGQMFGADVEVDLHLLELEAALPALEGVAMELDDCAFPLLKNVVCTADINVAMDGVNWVLLVGAVPRKAGMERADLLKINGKIFAPVGKAINQHAADDVRVFVVGNPCNTNALITMHHAADVPNDRFFAMTSLDQNRAMIQLAKKADVAVTDIKNMAIWGNHSNNQYPDFYHATISGKPATEVITDINWLENEFVPLVQKRGAQVIAARGASSAASAANAVVDGVHALLVDTAADDTISVGLCSNGEYGIDAGLIYSYPCRVTGGKIKVVEGTQHETEFAKQKLQTVLDELRVEKEAVASLL